MQNIQELKELTQNLKLLYVEDNEKFRLNTALYLNKLFSVVTEASNGEEALKLYKKSNFDIVIADIDMPKMNGLDMSEAIKKINKDQIILIISGYSEVNHFTKSIKLGVDGYLLKPIDTMQMNDILYKVALKIKTFKENEEYKDNLEEIIEVVSAESLKLYDEKLKNYDEMLIGLVDILESRDPYTAGHSQRVAKYSKLIAENMGYSQEECAEVFHAALIHDLGKIAIPDSVLLKPGRLTELEFSLIKEHSTIGYNLLWKMDMFKKTAKVIKHHHEKYDGSGYPDGLKGDEIPIFSQIMAIADTFDAMTTSRIYKSSKTIKEALVELKSLSGLCFKADVIEKSFEVLSKITLSNYVNQIPKNEFERERFSYFYRDQLTDAFNCDYLDVVLKSNQMSQKYDFIEFIELKHFSSLNEKYDWNRGSAILTQIANNIALAMEDDMLLFRIDGDDFIVVSAKKIDLPLSEITKLLYETDVKIEQTTYIITEHQIKSLQNFRSLL